MYSVLQSKLELDLARRAEHYFSENTRVIKAWFRGCCVAFVNSDYADKAASFVKNEYFKVQPELASHLNQDTAVVICDSCDSFDVESLVENLPGQLAGNQEIIVKVYDVTNRLDFDDPYRKHHMTSRYLHEVPISRTAIITAGLGYVIVILVGYMFYTGAIHIVQVVGYMFYTGAIHIVQVEDDFDTMQKLKVRAEAYDVAKSQLAVLISDKVPQIVMGDPGRFRQLITNLVGNSVKVSGFHDLDSNLYSEIITRFL
ncbi:putative histidine kinase, Protein-serine/threonine phosphatase [Helianthus anomalus]